MERVAEPLRRMGASVTTRGGTAPLVVEGAELHGVRYEMSAASAQVKSAVLLAGVAAAGETIVVEPAATRDHTERLLRALGAPVRTEGRTVTISAFAHDAFEGRVPGDLSSSAFLVAAAAATGGAIAIHDVGLNPTRSHYLEVMERMGVRTDLEVEREEMGEPVGTIRVHRVGRVAPHGGRRRRAPARDRRGARVGRLGSPRGRRPRGSAAPVSSASRRAIVSPR